MAGDEQVAMEVDAAPSAPPLPASVQKGLGNSVRYLVGNFLTEKHYAKIGKSLSNRWDRFQSLSAAMKLMEQHGVKLSPEEEQSLSQMNEAQMIESLVMKMPQQSKEQFQHFFLQLQLIVSTATRVRSALEQGDHLSVSQAMDDADSTGIAQYMLKMAIVQAGSEVTNLKTQHSAWVKDAEAKLTRLVRGAEEAANAKAKLAKAYDELSVFQSEASEKTKKVLMTLAGGSSTALLHGMFSEWHKYVMHMRVENMIYEEYREQIEAAETRLIDAKQEQLKGVKNMIQRKSAGAEASLVQEVFGIWQEELNEKKFAAENAEKIAALEAKLASSMDRQSQNAKKLMSRMGAAGENGMRDMCFHEWVTFHKEYLKNKEFEDQLKETEKRLQEFMKSKSAGAQSVLNKMSDGTDSGLLHEVLTEWYSVYKEEKEANEMAEMMNGAQGRFGSFGERNKKGAMSAMERAHQHQNMMIYLQFFNAWRMDWRVEKMLILHNKRIESKRQQLLGVQQMFRNFALQLESNINAGGVSDRGWDRPIGSPQKKSLQKAEGSVSLPDIHQKSGGYPQASNRSGASRARS